MAPSHRHAISAISGFPRRFDDGWPTTADKYTNIELHAREIPRFNHLPATAVGSLIASSRINQRPDIVEHLVPLSEALMSIGMGESNAKH